MTPLLELRDISKFFSRRVDLAGKIANVLGAHNQAQIVRAVDGVSLAVGQNEVVGLVGESGCGKSTLGRVAAGIHAPTAGEVLWRGQPVAGKRTDRDFALGIQMIFQDPYASLNPRLRVADIVGEAPLVHGLVSRRELADYVDDIMRRVGLDPTYKRRYPHQFSGGQRQRIGIARALAVKPKFLVCDEAVAALDVSIQAQVLNLLKDLQASLGLTYLFISHNLAVIDYVADRVAVMYGGRIVEMASKRDLFAAPRHPYTEALLAAVLQTDPRLRADHQVLASDGRLQAPPLRGCAYAPRCRYAVERCVTEPPELREVAPGHLVRCHRAEEIRLAPLLRRPRLAQEKHP
jgi:peptide/nickel transport system ATP-binding protein